MQKHLFFVCPSDCLEPIINNRFRNRNYYYTSLGNSVLFNDSTTEQIKRLITKNEIEEISFVLSGDNRIVLDALGNQHFSNVKGLNGFYNEIMRQKERSVGLWQTDNRQFSILSYYLNQKIKELELAFDSLPVEPPKIDDKQKNAFSNIYPDLICREEFSLN